jgi:hypothetical protein
MVTFIKLLNTSTGKAKFYIQADLVILGLFICEFAYPHKLPGLMQSSPQHACLVR